MSDHFIRDKQSRCYAIITMANIYYFGGFMFEFHPYMGPVKLKKNGKPAAREGRKFYQTIKRWNTLPAVLKEATRISK